MSLITVISGIGEKVSGIIYLHRISDPRVTKASRKNLDMFKALCGDVALSNVVFATTYWDTVPLYKGETREEELMNTRNLFQQLIVHGAKMMRLDHATESPQAILEYLLPKSTVEPQIVGELREGKAIKDTSAGSILVEQITKLMQSFQAEIALLKEELVYLFVKKDEELRRMLELRRQILQREFDAVLSDHRKLEDEATKNRRDFAQAELSFQQEVQLNTSEMQSIERETFDLSVELSNAHQATTMNEQRVVKLEIRDNSAFHM